VESTAPRWLMWAGIVLLLWSLMGVGAFLTQFFQSAETIAALPEAQRDLWTHMPAWDWVAYAIATFSALGGAICLLRRKAWAAPLYAISILFVLIQFTYPFLIARAFTSLAMAAFPVFIAGMGIFQWWLAKRWRKAGWLN
jgi:hypothetical protein